MSFEPGLHYYIHSKISLSGPGGDGFVRVGQVGHLDFPISQYVLHLLRDATLEKDPVANVVNKIRALGPSRDIRPGTGIPLPVKPDPNDVDWRTWQADWDRMEAGMKEQTQSMPHPW